MKDRTMRLAACALATVLLGGTVCVAHAEEDEKGPNTGRISLSITNDFTNVYFFRGIRQERDGFIWQPYIDIGVKLWESEDAPIRGVTLGMGVWNSFHSRKTLSSGSGPSNLYETDYYPSLTLDLPGGFSTAFTYYVYTGPNGSFDTVQEFAYTLSLNDADYLGKFALNPSITAAFETERTSFGDKRGSWIGPKIEPTLYAYEGEHFGLTLSAPIEAGFSIDNYYEEANHKDRAFGYLAWGLTASMPINCIPKDFGSWSFGITGRGYYLSNALARANSGDNLYPQVVGSLGMSY